MDTAAGADQGGVVLGWLTRVTVVLGCLGLLAFDAASVAVAQLQARSDAGTAAVAAAASFSAVPDVRRSYASAVATLRSSREAIEPASFLVKGGVVTLVLTRPTDTLWMWRVAPLRRFTVVRAHGSGSAP